MNFLAHLYLSDHTPPGRIGAIWPDLVRRSKVPPPHPAIEAGIHLHRRIDAFTNTHPLFGQSKMRLLARHGRFSGILVDLFYDHVLAAAFEQHHRQPLPEFVAAVYADFRAHEEWMPAAMRAPVTWMIEQNWLGSYATVEGMAVRLAQMSARLSAHFDRAIDLTAATDDLRLHREAFAADFHAFFPQLRAYAAGHSERTIVIA